MTGSLKFDVGALKEKGRAQVREDVPAADYQEAVSGHAALRGPVSVALDLEVRGGQVLLRGRLSGRWELECCRCLARHDFPYTALVEASALSTQPTVDAADEVRQALVLALPMLAYCRPDCKGLCVQCGANKNLKECSCAPPRFELRKTGESDA